ncbi:MAG: bifunctional riboflavin kinase/FAD synthetase, partial [Oscillospiraceae bacterium]|nr:bifunctional riboflavin kinase/FAD synthetase [Oscillospiraceae bacterium]
LIMPNENKIEILERTGVDFVYLRKFDKDFMERTPLEFVRFLRTCLKIRGICVGYDYRFGHKAEGDTELLKKLGKIYGFEVSVAECIRNNGQIVGSTLIRRLINEGKPEEAARLLGRNFFVEGTVAEGLQNGRKMGYPTANVDFDPRMAVPFDGVYAGYTYVDSVKYKSVINIGNNPTFNGKKITLESHIIDFDEDIYTKYVRVEFVARIRGEKKFDGPDELKRQISLDLETAERLLE